ncbi:hypothetical protein C2S53_016330 [Perilla frutescens var. hirtella]|uniref:Uncharacterized protein n=1 Tax=Perilla frutescens var. hirtella TaxID=608512 RepID=A0AAD4JF91_PERFH|nr:hypothetical protein C2S53_016330 [Perilla frutescens var. hirtella]
MIRQIARLKQVVNHWKSRSLRGSNFILFYTSSYDDSDEPADANRRTLSGSIAVHINTEHRRFVIPIRFFNLPMFVTLLN